MDRRPAYHFDKAMARLDEGTLLGRYRLGRLLGRGGMGEVWQARDERLEREVALKVLPTHLTAEAGNRRRFEREARALGRLLHPNIVTIFDVGTADPGDGSELPFLVMELVVGRTLAAELAGGPLPPDRAVAIIEQVARALAAAHRCGIVHRDLKPANVMLTADEQVKVLDFGLARLFREGDRPAEESLTTTGAVMGSYGYMSPEQATGKEVGPAGDVFSCGIILYECLAGQRPFVGSSPVDVLRAIADSKYVPIERIAPEVSPGLVAIVERCLARDGRHRYPDASSLAHDLRALRSAGSSASVASTQVVAASRVEAVYRRRLRRAVRIVALVAAVATVGLAVGVLLGRSGMEPLRPDPGRWTTRAVLQSPGLLRHPRWHPQGKALLVERIAGAQGEVLLVPAEGGDTQVLARSRPGEFLSTPGLSSDGRLLAYGVIGAGSAERLEVIPVTGGPPLTVVADTSRSTWLDERRLVYSRVTKGVSALWVLDVAQQRSEPLHITPEGVSWWLCEPRPGGGFALLGGAADDTHGRLYVTPPHSLAARPWSDEARVEGFSWAPSGDTLVAIVERKLVRINARGSAGLLPESADLLEPSFSPEGDRLAMVSNTAQTDLVSIDPASGASECLLCGVTGAGWGSVAGDGAIAYRRLVGPLRSVFVRSPDGQERRLIPADQNGFCPSFSPDGRRLAYLARGAKGDELRVVSREGGASVTLAEDVVGSEFPSWSPDGRFLAFAAGDPAKVWVVSGGGGTPRLLTPQGGNYPQWSPDGRLIAYVIWTAENDPNQGAWVVDAAGGRPVRVSPSSTSLAWGPNGRALLQLRLGDGRLEVWRATTGAWQWRRSAVVALGAPPAPQADHLPVTVDPGTGRLVFNRRTTSGELLVFEGVDHRRW